MSPKEMFSELSHLIVSMLSYFYTCGSRSTKLLNRIQYWSGSTTLVKTQDGYWRGIILLLLSEHVKSIAIGRKIIIKKNNLWRTGTNLKIVQYAQVYSNMSMLLH